MSGPHLCALAEQDAIRIREKNQALSALDPMTVQEQYQRYLTDFNSGGLTPRRIGNLIRKTEDLIAVLRKAQRILTGGRTMTKRKTSPQPIG